MDTSAIPSELYSTTERVVFFPVRHHSPTAARLVHELIQQIRPAAVLIEGPSDFNDKIAEMTLPHALPIAIYSYVKLPDETRRGAFYPFSAYSPEWQAILTGHDIGAAVRFIDLPWAAMAASAEATHRYADGEMRVSPFIPHLVRELGVESFDDVWDTLFEIDLLTPDEYLKRAHLFCSGLRLGESRVRPVDIVREAFMAAQITQALNEFEGSILVITGGFHSLALFNRLKEDCPLPELPPDPPERGIALTPYSYERLDSLRGYESGMPNPGFYHHMFSVGSYRDLLAQVAKRLRERGQRVSAADLIAVETSAQALATLRGHARVWRRDVLDGVIAALVKDELAYDLRHPFLEAVYDVFRGDARGRLAEGATLPPFVIQLKELLASCGLLIETTNKHKDVRFNLFNVDDRDKSRILHQVRVLQLPGYEQTGSSDRGEDRIEETWHITWSPEFEGACIEAAIYGASLDDAARAKLYEQAAKLNEPNAARAAALLLDAALMGLPASAQDFYKRLVDIIGQDGNFITVSEALGSLLYLYRFDVVLGTSQHTNVGELLRTAFARSLLLLETSAIAGGQERELIDGVRAVMETFERCTALLTIAREDFAAVFTRLAAETKQTPLLRGAATGVVWSLGSAIIDLQPFSNPEDLGDFLTGLFRLAREVVQREPALIERIDTALMRFDEEGFLAALPSLRLAFSFFVPREKFYLTRSLFGKAADMLPALQVDIKQAARALMFEDALFKAVEKYGLEMANESHISSDEGLAHDE
jgi:hypothetical protein